jgi:hypothetical protein
VGVVPRLPVGKGAVRDLTAGAASAAAMKHCGASFGVVHGASFGIVAVPNVFLLQHPTWCNW